jgi:hypothetical protein
MSGDGPSGEEHGHKQARDKLDFLDTEVRALESALRDLRSGIQSRDADLKRLDRAKRTLDENIRTVSQEVRVRFDQELGDLTEQSQSLMKALEANKKKSSDIVRTISSEANRSAFHGEAEQQRSRADSWRLMSVLLSLCAVALLVALSLRSPAHLDIANSLQHVALSIIVLGIGGYAAAQSAQHRRREEAARRLELDIETLDPLTEGLPEDERLKIRAKVIATIFNRQDVAPEGTGNGSGTSVDLSALGSFFTALGRNPGQPPNA